MFDDFVVTGPNILDGGPGAKAVHPEDKLATMWARLKAPEEHKDFCPKRRGIQIRKGGQRCLGGKFGFYSH